MPFRLFYPKNPETKEIIVQSKPLGDMKSLEGRNSVSSSETEVKFLPQSNARARNRRSITNKPHQIQAS